MTTESKATEYFDFLNEVYQKKPGMVLTILSGNKAYVKAGDVATLRVFKDLFRLINPSDGIIFEKRREKWWRKRHSILGNLLTKKLISSEQMLKFAQERRR
jgi:hypothetical protein